MDRSKLIASLGEYSPSEASNPVECPDALQLAAYMDGGLEEQQFKTLQAHIAECDDCSDVVGVLAHAGNDDSNAQADALTLARAQRLGKTTRLPAYAPRWAAAAVVVLALIVVTTRGPQPEEAPLVTAPDEQQVLTNPRQLRSIDRAALAPKIISPLEGDNIEPGDLKVQWTEVQGSLHYDVRVVSAEGFIVWNGRVEGTEWQPPVDQSLEPGVSYFVRVDAYLAVADSVSSEHVLFTMEDKKE